MRQLLVFKRRPHSGKLSVVTRASGGQPSVDTHSLVPLIRGIRVIRGVRDAGGDARRAEDEAAHLRTTAPAPALPCASSGRRETLCAAAAPAPLLDADPAPARCASAASLLGHAQCCAAACATAAPCPVLRQCLRLFTLHPASCPSPPPCFSSAVPLLRYVLLLRPACP